MKRRTRFVVYAVVLLPLVLCAAVAVRVSKRRIEFAVARGTASFHLSVTRDAVRIIRASDWADAAAGAAAAERSPGAGPVVGPDAFVEQVFAVRSGLRSKYNIRDGIHDGMKWRVDGRMVDVRVAVRDRVRALAGEPASEPILAVAPPERRRVAAVELARGSAVFGLRDPDGQASYFGPPVRVTSVSVPPWIAVLPFGLPAAIGLGAWFARSATRASRARRRHCPACGYDLRATPDRCPECGATPALPPPSPIHADSGGVGSVQKSQAP